VPRKIIHIDVDPSSISKRVKVDIPIVGDVKNVLTDLIAQIKEQGLNVQETALADWWKKIDGWRGRKCLAYPMNDTVIKPQFVVQKLWEVTKGDRHL
jgi:acetolactate synthase-1/2/3 large subunit